MTTKIKYISPEAKNYGQALVELGFTLEQISEMENIFQTTPELLEVLTNPAVELAPRRQLVDRIFALDQGSQPLDSSNNSGPIGQPASLIKYLMDKGRLPMIHQILAATKELLLSQNNTVTAKLSYVSKPTDNQLAKMEKILKDKLNCQHINWEFTKDSKLLGGFRLDAGDLYFDYSVKGRLDEMKNRLSGNSGR